MIPLPELSYAEVAQNSFRRNQEHILRQEVRDAIEMLEEKYRLPTILHYLSGFSYREISDFLGAPISTVRSRLQDARQILRKEFFTMVEKELKKQRLTSEFTKKVMDSLTNFRAITLLDLTVNLRWNLPPQEQRKYIQKYYIYVGKKNGNEPEFDFSRPIAIVDGKGQIWAGELGVSVFDGTNWKMYTEEDGLCGNNVRNLLLESQGRIWAAGEGVSVFDGKRWRAYTAEEHGLCSDKTYALIEDSKGQIKSRVFIDFSDRHYKTREGT
ncbi:MAG: sigma factor-like helix-turn-helix DNA-binding protein [Candidatus Poribacteria bacterium]